MKKKFLFSVCLLTKIIYIITKIKTEVMNRCTSLFITNKKSLKNFFLISENNTAHDTSNDNPMEPPRRRTDPRTSICFIIFFIIWVVLGLGGKFFSLLQY